MMVCVARTTPHQVYAEHLPSKVGHEDRLLQTDQVYRHGRVSH